MDTPRKLAAILAADMPFVIWQSRKERSHVGIEMPFFDDSLADLQGGHARPLEL